MAKAKPSTPDKLPKALLLIKKDHDAVAKLFEAFEVLSGDDDADEKEEIVVEACTMLKIHAQMEEEVFYPALRSAIDEQDLIDEAEVEHMGAKNLISDLDTMSPGDELYDAKFTVLMEYIRHHVKEEEGEIFPAALESDLNLDELGDAMDAKKEELAVALG